MSDSKEAPLLNAEEKGSNQPPSRSSPSSIPVLDEPPLDDRKEEDALVDDDDEESRPSPTPSPQNISVRDESDGEEPLLDDDAQQPGGPPA